MLTVRCHLFSFVLLVSCAEDSSRITAPPPPGSTARPVPSAAPAVSATPPAEHAPAVAGLVVDDAATPIVGRPYVVVDARGTRTEGLTDEEGTFYAKEVVAPYDIAFAPAPSGSIVVPVAYLGLSRRDPTFVLAERDGSLAPSPHLVRLTVTLPPCAAEACWVTVATSSAHGEGAASRGYGRDDASASFEIEHTWHVDDLAIVEPIDVHVLTGDDGWSSFAYARASGVDGTPGEATDVGVTPTAIAATSPVTITAQGPTVPIGWAWFVATRILLPGGAPMTLKIAAGPALVMRLPRVDGANFDTTAWSQRPDDDGPQASVTAWSGPLPLRTPQVLVDLPSIVEVVRPQPGGTLARRGAGMAWRPSRPGLVTVASADATRDHRDFRVHTSADGLSFARLSQLGIARPELGQHIVDITNRWDSDVDSLTDPAETPWSMTVPGGAAYQRMSVTVTP